MPTSPTKKCSRCEKRKPLDAFSRFFRGEQGRQAWCKSCMKQHAEDKQYRRIALNP